ncbi:MAG TPA: diaminobutyrate acetyltransferase [Acidimicrobiales bacterium]
MSGDSVLLRAPTTDDGADLWRLARSCGLDLNSPYLYLLWCHDFADTSVIAQVDQGTVGFVTGYRRPAEPATLFVSQVAVGKAWRRQGLAIAMLEHLRDRLAPTLRFVEASVTSSNEASAGLFRSLAASSEVELASGKLFDGFVFPAECPHDAELLMRVGPFRDSESTPGARAHLARATPA